MSTYTIKEGDHYASGLHFGLHFGITEQKYRVKFSKECLYTPLDWENDWNKLCGWSYGLHHKNSIRVCWRPYVPNTDNPDYYIPTQIELCIYVYENGARKISEHTKIVNVDKDYELILQYLVSNRNGYSGEGIIGLIGNTESDYLTITLPYSTKPSLGYRLYPYFGGQSSTPHNLTIELQRL